jgi:hypothetical protein
MSALTLLRRVAAGSALLLMAAALTPFTGATPALAHERRALDKYSLLVGFNEEPAIQGEPNAMQFTVTEPDADNRPVEGLADTVKATVAFGGGQPKEFKLRANRDRPGQYLADFIPTRAGSYIFNFTGAIEGTPINERFESGPGRFNDVEPVESLQFPEAVPLANDAARAARSASDQAAAAAEDASNARTLGLAGIGVGVVGLLVGAIALGLLFTRRPAEMVRAEPRSQRP